MLIFFLSLITFCQGYEYKKLKKYSSVEVPGESRVFLNITSFKTGEVISFEFEMELFFGMGEERSSYTFKIGQVSTLDYNDGECWNSLPTVTNRNFTQSGMLYDTTFTWDEVKVEGKNYIFMYLPSPYSGFNFFKKKMKVRNTGGNAVVIALAIVIPVVVIIIIIIVVYCYRKRRSCANIYNSNTQSLIYPQTPQTITQQPYSQQQPIYDHNSYNKPINEIQNYPNQVNLYPNTTQQQYQNQYNNQNVNQQQQGYNSSDINQKQQVDTSYTIGFDDCPPPAI